MIRSTDILRTFAVCVALVCVPARAAEAPVTHHVAPNASLSRKADRGWFFYQDPLHRKAQPLPAPAASEKSAPIPKSVRCKSPTTWSADCGFVDPGKNFAFQKHERDALLQNMSLSHHDPKAVEAVQYYMRWLMQRASEAANLWYYNLVQNPEFDPQARQPISAFGLKLMTQVQHNHAADIYKALRDQGAMLVFFSRSDCEFCHSMAPLVQHVARDTNLTLWDASLDDQCIPGLEAHCRTSDAVLKPAEALQVKVVPTLFLYVAPNTWIRVANGVSDVQTMEARIVSFFSAYRTALLKSVHNGKGVTPPVDFSDTPAVSGVAKGAPAGTARLPTQAEIRGLLSR